MAKKRTSPCKSYPPPFSMRFTEDERKTLELAAGDRPLGAYIRWLIFGNDKDMPAMPKARTRGESASLDHKKLAKLLGALGKSRIASNINQLARAANSGSLPVNEDVLKSLFEAVRSIEWMRGKLIEGMGIKAQGKNKENPHDT